jgi:hypothetical protein
MEFQLPPSFPADIGNSPLAGKQHSSSGGWSQEFVRLTGVPPALAPAVGQRPALKGRHAREVRKLALGCVEFVSGGGARR